jgi:hypothetical protein
VEAIEQRLIFPVARVTVSRTHAQALHRQQGLLVLVAAGRLACKQSGLDFEEITVPHRTIGSA